MKRLFSFLLIMMLLLCSCTVEYEDAAAPGERVENELSSQAEVPSSGKSEGTESQGTEKSEAENAKKPSEEEGAKPQKALGAGWESKGAYLYEERAYYSVCKEEVSYVYSLKLGKEQAPQYLCKGEVRGIYGDFLLGIDGGRYALMDLSKEAKWAKLSIAPMEEEALFYVGDRLLIFGDEEVAVINLAKKTGRKEKLKVEIDEIRMEGDRIFYSVEKGVEQILYCGELSAKKSEELFRFDEEYEWVAVGEKLLLSKDGENPVLLDAKTKETSIPRQFYCTLSNGPPTPKTFDNGDGSVTVRYRNEQSGEWHYWRYDIVAGVGTEEAQMPSFHTALDGGSYTCPENGVMLLSIDGKEYRLSGKGITSANQYGAAFADKGLIYTVRWQEGNSYEYYAVADHPAP